MAISGRDAELVEHVVELLAQPRSLRRARRPGAPRARHGAPSWPRRSSESQVARRDEHEPLLARERDPGRPVRAVGRARRAPRRARRRGRLAAEPAESPLATRSSRTSGCDGGTRRARRAAAPRRASASRRCCSRPARPLATSSASCSARRIAVSAVSAPLDEGASDDRRRRAVTPAGEQRRADLAIRCACSRRLSGGCAMCNWRAAAVSEPVRPIATTSSRSRSIHTATVTNAVCAYTDANGDARGSDRRHGAHADRQAQGRAGRLAPDRSPGVHAAGSDRAHGHRSRTGRRRHRRLRHAGRRAGLQRDPQRVGGGGSAAVGAVHVGRPAVRLVAAGACTSRRRA